MQTTPKNNPKFSNIFIKPISPRIVLAIISLAIFVASIFMGAITGISTAKREIKQIEEVAVTAVLAEQYILAQEDIAAERYDIAQQRLVYILDKDPNFPGVAETLVEVVKEMNLSGEPITFIAEPTLTPTPDTRPVEQLFTEAGNLINNREWQKAIDTLTSLRKADPDYLVSQVDGYLYLALRYLGVEKILQKADLEGGIYDLALAEKFAPIDGEASSALYLARMYMYGLSFWEVIPEQAVYYFAQVASAAPYMQDGSGYTARLRYREALIQYGDKLAANKEWCNAVSQYSLALAIEADNSLQSKIKDANDICSPPTETPGPTATMTPTETPTIIYYAPTSTQTSTSQVSITDTPASNTATPTLIVESTAAPTATLEATQAPVASDTPVPTDIPTEAPTAEPTEETTQMPAVDTPSTPSS